MQAPPLPHSESFPWPETGPRLEALRAAGPLAPDPTGRWYEQRAGAALRAALRPPLLLLDGTGLPVSDVLLERTADGPGRYAILLVQAGAAAMGLFEDDDVLEHKAIKRYVVRGKGRAQPTHLRTRGKSRYGARLRLRNAERLLRDVGRRLATWWADPEPPERLYLSAPVRIQADLDRAEPPLPLGPDDPRRVRIPLDVAVPTHAELMRVHRSLSRGRQWAQALPCGGRA